MQDIIDECGISRGGIYIYFASVDEVFLEVMKQRNKERISGISKAVHDHEPFDDVFQNYMAKQKARLVNFENSLFRAYCEYLFSKPKAAVQAFRDTQLNQLRDSIEAILMLGAQQGVIDGANVSKFATHIIATIDGLSVLALGNALTEEIINEQFEILSDIIYQS